MEFNIPDLLDGLEVTDIGLTPVNGSSAERIKELTMKKIRSERKPARRVSSFGRVLIAAAILASLAVPVMAATGFHLTDWLENMYSGTGDYGSDLQLGSESKNWEVSGWVFNLKAENVEDTGLTIICDQWDGQEKSGSLATNESYWLEAWNGQGYEKLPDPAKEIPAGKTLPIEAGSTNRWEVDWSDTYGVLEPGAYRLGKEFTYTSDAGQTETVTYSTKFRVFPREMDSHIDRCKAALEALRTRHSYHLTNTYTGYESDHDFEKFITNQWKSGEDFLIERQYFGDSGKLVQHDGYLMRHGRGYKLTWNNDNVLSGVASWEAIDWLDESNRDMWNLHLTIYDAEVAEVYGEENTTHLLTSLGALTGNIRYSKMSFVTDQMGNLTAAQLANIPGFEEPDQEDVTRILEVHDTSADEIARVIAAQAVDKAVPFSWEEDQKAYPAGAEGVKTEGFVNTASQGAVTLQNVVSIAKKECTLEWQNTAVVFYDEAAQIWKVELGFSQDDTVCQRIYLNSQGITQRIAE